jgi:hypothetical protein
LTICFSRIRWCKRITPRVTLPGPGTYLEKTRFKRLWNWYKNGNMLPTEQIVFDIVIAAVTIAFLYIVWVMGRQGNHILAIGLVIAAGAIIVTALVVCLSVIRRAL